MPDSPIDPVAGTARVVGAEVRAPQFEIVNHSRQPVRYVEIGWIVKDRSGNEFVAGSLPSDVNLAPGQKASVSQKSALRFASPAGSRVEIETLTGFVNHVEFADGKMWIPSRNALQDPHLRRAMAPSPEEQRLTDLYRRKGLNAVLEQLKRY
jgi:hypothetical protein